MKGMVGMSDVAPNSTITELGLLLSHTPLEDKDLKVFVAGLSNMVSLKKLKLYIGNLKCIYLILNRWY